MYKQLLFTGAVCALLAACDQPKEKAREPKQFAIEDLYDNVTINDVGFNKDESKVLVNSNRTGIFNVYELTIADSSLQPLTRSSKESCFGDNYIPGRNQFIYSSDKGGDENSHLFLAAKGDTAGKDITPWPGSANNFNGWNENKTSMYVSSNKRNPKFFDTWKMDTTTWQATMLYQNDSGYTVDVISQSERYLALNKSITTDKNELYLYDRQTKTMKQLSNDHEATWTGATFEKNDSIFYYTTNDDNEFTYVVKYNINSGKADKYYENKWDVLNMTLGETEKYHSIFINEDGVTKVLLFDHATNKPIELPEMKDMSVSGIIISPTEKNLLLTIGSSTSPSNIFLYNIENKELKQLTSTLNKAIDENDLVKAEVIRFKSFDGLDIPAIYYKPLQADENKKVGALVWVHGGPGGQSTVGFSNSIQYLVNRGYAVLAVNNRGSSGYGKTFYKMDNKDHANA
ncbi:MAG: prolyl oligopeptidase family serine peptidase, partial [Chitinophagaceae bacterium]